MHLIQLTDTHLLREIDQELKGINTEKTFLSVLNLIKQGKKPDAVILTGDIAESGDNEAYQRIKRHLDDLKCPLLWIPGNHDHAHHMMTVFGRKEMKNKLANWNIVLLDTTVPQQPYGYLSQEKLERLDICLAQCAEQPTLVAMHHHPCPMNSKHIDEHCLKNGIEFWEIVKKHPSVKLIICGHVHQEHMSYVGNKLFLACPSTAFQFRPGSEHFEKDNIGPGYRWFDLNPDGSAITGVVRVES